VEVRGVGWPGVMEYWMPRPVEEVHSRLSGDGPKVLGLLRGRPGARCVGAWKTLEGSAIG
jgi:hypothetical protein